MAQLWQNPGVLLVLAPHVLVSRSYKNMLHREAFALFSWKWRHIKTRNWDLGKAWSSHCLQTLPVPFSQSHAQSNSKKFSYQSYVIWPFLVSRFPPMAQWLQTLAHLDCKQVRVQLHETHLHNKHARLEQLHEFFISNKKYSFFTNTQNVI